MLKLTNYGIFVFMQVGRKILEHRFAKLTMIGTLLFGILIGVWMAKWQPILFSPWYLLVFILPVITAYKKRSLIWFFIVLTIGLISGLQRASIFTDQLSNYRAFIGSEVTIRGVVSEDPTYDDKRRLDFKLKNVEINNQTMIGEVRIKTFGANSVARGDFVQSEGKLSEGFGNYQAAIYFADSEVLTKSTNIIENLRREFFAGVHNAVSDPQASLGLGFLVGLKAGLPEDLEEQLRMLALTHIVVASGYNLTILTRIARRSLNKLSKQQIFISSTSLVFLMVFMTGWSPSMSRAALVTLLSLLVWYYGRKAHPVMIILFSSALTAWWNPLFIWFDLGWWLSFLAFIGVLILAPMITKKFFKNKKPPLLAQVGIETISAQILVEPLILLTFGQFSTLGIIANLLIVPFVPFAMLATFVAGVVGVILPGIAGWFGIFAEWIIGYIVEVVRLLSNLPWAAKEIEITGFVAAMLYVLVFLLMLVFYKITKFKFRESPNVVE